MHHPVSGAANPATHVKIPMNRLVAYSTLQLPLAMCALPVVLNVPKFYGETLGLPLAALGVYLIITRVIDALQDPLIGLISDRMTRRRNGRLLLAALMMPALVGGFVALFYPPSELLGRTGLQIWLLVSLIVVHLGYAGVSITYHAHGAELSDDYNERTKVTVGREVFGLTGMTLAVVLPALLTSPNFFAETKSAAAAATDALAAAKAAGDQVAAAAAQVKLKAAQHEAEIRGYGMFGLLFVAIALITAVPSLLRSPPSVHGPVKERAMHVTFGQFTDFLETTRLRWFGRALVGMNPHGSGRRAWTEFFFEFLRPLKNRLFRRLLLVFIVNGSALGIAVSVMLFYVEHVLKGTKTDTGIILLTYFVAGAASVPLWMWLSKRTSKTAAWFIGIAMTAVAMTSAVFFGPGQIWMFVAVSAITGLGLGADYGLPPSILADTINAEDGKDTRGETGAYFGLWALSTKAATAIGAAFSLPIAQWLGFNPGAGKFDTQALVVVYIVLPVLVKLLAGGLLWYMRLEADRPAARDVLLKGG